MEGLRYVRSRAVRLAVAPSQARQFKGPLALLWSSLPGKPRSGLACNIRCCTNPACDCRDARVLAVTVEAGLSGLLSEHATDLTLAYPVGDEPKAEEGAEVSVNVDTGEVSLVTGAPRALEAFRAEVDSQLLEKLRERFTAAKGANEDWRTADWSDLERGMMVGWDEVFPAAADGAVQAAGKVLLPFEDHCIEPDCDCGAVRVGFMESLGTTNDAGAPDLEEVGSVQVSLASGAPVRWDPLPGRTDLLRAAWTAYATPRRHEVLLERDRRMKQIGPELLAGASRSPPVRKKKVGPNEPCPCGSSEPPGVPQSLEEQWGESLHLASRLHFAAGAREQPEVSGNVATRRPRHHATDRRAARRSGRPPVLAVPLPKGGFRGYSGRGGPR